MTTERVGNMVGFSCETCFECTEEFEDFDTLLRSSKRMGWKIYQEGGEWCHTCPACSEGPREKGETDLQRAQRLLGKPKGR